MTPMTIGRLAKSAGVNIDTVRYYERSNLLPPAARSASGYRRYDGSDLQRLRFVRSAQQLGFSLEEIRELQRLVDVKGDRAAVRRLAQVRLADIEDRVQRLTRLRDSLRELVAACHGHGSVDDCPIVEAVVGGDTAKAGSGRKR